MSWAYLAALLVSTAGMATLDARHRLFLWRAPVRAALVVLCGLAYFLVWDAAGIATGLFRHLDSEFATGLLVAPHMPIEEIVFLVFLSYLTMVLLMGAGRLLGRDGTTDGNATTSTTGGNATTSTTGGNAPTATTGRSRAPGRARGPRRPTGGGA